MTKSNTSFNSTHKLDVIRSKNLLSMASRKIMKDGDVADWVLLAKFAIRGL